jgi:hypothetical protein
MSVAGDTMEVPKGTTIYDGTYFYEGTDSVYFGQEPTVGVRASKVTIDAVVDLSKRWWALTSEQDRTTIRARFGVSFPDIFTHARNSGWSYNPVTSGGPRNGVRMTDEEADIFLVNRRVRIPVSRQEEWEAYAAELRAMIETRYPGMKFAKWSKGKKAALLSDLVPATAAAPKPKAEKAITKRRQMVKGSIWSFPEPVEIKINVDNPEIDALIMKRRDMPNRTMEEKAAYDVVHQRILNTPKTIEKLAARIPAGTRVEVIDKAQTSYGNNGLLIPFRILEQKIAVAAELLGKGRWYNPLHHSEGILLPYAQIEPTIVAESIPETISYVLRDSATGEFWGGWETEPARWGTRTTDKAKMSATFSGAKKFVNMAALKASIMDFTGYHKGLEIEGYVGEWVGSGDTKMKLSETWEAVAIDKTTNTEKEVIDVQGWYRELLRLRVITSKVNSAVRGVFKKVEGNPDFAAIVSFALPEDLWDDEKMEPSDAKLIKDAMSNAEGKTLTHKTPYTHAFAVATGMDADLVALSYSGPAIVNVYDSTTLDEIVVNGEAA